MRNARSRTLLPGVLAVKCKEDNKTSPFREVVNLNSADGDYCSPPTGRYCR
jgi:hypothetical protein